MAWRALHREPAWHRPSAPVRSNRAGLAAVPAERTFRRPGWAGNGGFPHAPRLRPGAGPTSNPPLEASRSSHPVPATGRPSGRASPTRDTDQPVETGGGSPGKGPLAGCPEHDRSVGPSTGILCRAGRVRDGAPSNGTGTWRKPTRGHNHTPRSASGHPSGSVEVWSLIATASATTSDSPTTT